MRRVFIAAVSCAALFACMHRPASAMVEFCPAGFQMEPVPSTTVFGFEMNALGPRTIADAMLAFDTDAGWYTVRVPSVTLSEKDRHYSSPSATFVKRTWISPAMYLRFPVAVKIANSWVYEAQVRDDGAFGWEAKGTVQCYPPSSARSAQTPSRFQNRITLDPNDLDRLSGPPPSGATILDAKPSPPLESTNCEEPFRPATAVHLASPSYPMSMENYRTLGVNAVDVAIDTDGSVADAWIWAPSGYRAFDDAAVEAASHSTYKNARAYCKDVPGIYLFRVTFD
jgi:TonB family protein